MWAVRRSRGGWEPSRRKLLDGRTSTVTMAVPKKERKTMAKKSKPC
jgi:hypothetical protein